MVSGTSGLLVRTLASPTHELLDHLSRDLVLCLSFVICKLGMTIVTTWQIIQLTYVMCLKQCLAPSRRLIHACCCYLFSFSVLSQLFPSLYVFKIKESIGHFQIMSLSPSDSQQSEEPPGAARRAVLPAPPGPVVVSEFRELQKGAEFPKSASLCEGALLTRHWGLGFTWCSGSEFLGWMPRGRGGWEQAAPERQRGAS